MLSWQQPLSFNVYFEHQHPVFITVPTFPSVLSVSPSHLRARQAVQFTEITRDGSIRANAERVLEKLSSVCQTHIKVSFSSDVWTRLKLPADFSHLRLRWSDWSICSHTFLMLELCNLETAGFENCLSSLAVFCFDTIVSVTFFFFRHFGKETLKISSTVTHTYQLFLSLNFFNLLNLNSTNIKCSVPLENRPDRTWLLTNQHHSVITATN